MLCLSSLSLSLSLSLWTEQFLSDGDIGVDISVTSSPIIKSNYIESYHKVWNKDIIFKNCIQTNEHFSNPLMWLLLFFSCDFQGLVIYNNTKTNLNTSVFNPSQLTENRMLYFWLSDGLLDPLMAAVHHDGRFIRNISGTELMVWNDSMSWSRLYSERYF